MDLETATELEFLQWFYANADFGPADGDVRIALMQDFVAQVGKNLPEGYSEQV